MHTTGLPKISIITPSFNQGKYLDQTIRSVLQQDYPNLEYLVIDGGSTDQTLDILRHYQGRLQLLCEPDRGQVHAINKGLSLVKGELVTFLNSDDLLAPQALNQVGDFFRTHPNARWVSGRCKIIDENGSPARNLVTAYKNFWLATGSKTVLKIINYISQPSTFWRLELVQQIGSFSENLPFAFDYDYWLRIAQQYPLSVLKTNLAFFRVHSNSKSWSATTKQLQEEMHIAKTYTTSPILLGLHYWHTVLVSTIYRKLQSKDQPGFSGE